MEKSNIDFLRRIEEHRAKRRPEQPESKGLNQDLNYFAEQGET